MIEKIWQYYKDLADLVVDKDGMILPYSLSFFFKKPYEEIQNELLNAFFGVPVLNWKNSEEFVMEKDLKPYFCTEREPYPAQIEAIYHAVNDPISLVQGPPGTGKTEMILNLISVIHGLYPSKTIAIVSSNNEAVENITDQIEDEGEDSANKNLQAIRTHFAKLGNRSNRKQCKELKGYICDKQKYLVNPEFLKKYPVFSSSIHSLRKIFGNGFDQQFDFVIVDECSQISIMLGLLAMSCARQLVLVGDTEQIPPILKDIDKHNREFGKEIPDIYKEKGEKSFLDVCDIIFQGNIHSTQLNQHYRCHPSIINFCNENVYSKRLIVKTKREFEDEFRIRAVWYEGDYCEEIKKKKGSGNGDRTDNGYINLTLEELLKNPGKRNLRQLKIFIEEEWPGLRKRAEEGSSICVLSPYRLQLEILKQMIDKKLEEEQNQKLQSELTINGGLEENIWNSESFVDIPCLTIHKSQGRGYDIVYLLTVEDYSRKGNWPWCQRKRIINVAVSRAKKEFCIITSAQWLPQNMENKEKPGYIPPLLKPLEERRQTDEPNQLFYCKLLTYIDQNCPEPQGKFGLHKSKITSVFDQVPLYRDIYKTGEGYQDAYSAPARCMRDMLVKEFGTEYTILCEVPLKKIEQLDVDSVDEDLIPYIEHARLDFVLCKGNEIRLILEIDGAVHRDPNRKEVQERDKKKNKLFQEIFHMGKRYLRIPTNGTTSQEADIVRNLLESTNIVPTLTLNDETIEKGEKYMDMLIKKDTLVKRFNEIIGNNLERLKEQTQGDSISDEVKACLKNNYKPSGKEQNVNGISYADELWQQIYLCRYGVAYAFEYAMMYDIIMRSYKKESDEEKILGAYSFGCGSMIDAWSMAYAKLRLQQDNPAYEKYKLYYRGVDAQPWKENFVDPENSGQIEELFNKIKYIRCDINRFVDNCFLKTDNKAVYYNVLMFPKILNELKSEDVKVMIKKLSQCNFMRDEYYICVSHSPTDIDKGRGLKAVQDLVDAINANGEFEVCSDIKEMLGESFADFKKVWLADGKDEDIFEPEKLGSYKYYMFKSAYLKKNGQKSIPTNIASLNSDFQAKEVKSYMETIENKLKDQKSHVRQITTVSQIAFQIIQLKKNKKKKEA